ncbi:hypothetical protein COO60DRAFT_1526180 [Scenedesmus sp. NREL 46B-D3]|nr:hypothetical protein COO60DRAFT_1526180 [Scenedesmus sp. NREL 46B-D3]
MVPAECTGAALLGSLLAVLPAPSAAAAGAAAAVRWLVPPLVLLPLLSCILRSLMLADRFRCATCSWRRMTSSGYVTV